MNFYLLYEPNNALCVFTIAYKLQFQISIPRGKIVQNVKFSPVNQNSDFKFKIIFYSSTRVQEYVWFPKQSLGYQVIKVSRKSRRKSLPREMWFLTEACFEILRLPLDSLHQNEFEGGFRFRFWVLVCLVRKMMQT